MRKIFEVKNWSTVRLLTIGFAVVILLGTILLSFPVSSKDGQKLSFLNALFTSTSATCVTGLSLYDTYTQFSIFGQAVILILIQVGGLGFITLMILFSLMMRKKIGLRERSLFVEGVGSLQLTGVVRMVKRIVFGTIIFESMGAVLLAIRFIPRLGLAQGLWSAVFHSVSAFCNAGFDIMGIIEPSSSLKCYYNDPIVIITICMLIIVGGIGFVVWTDLIDCKFKPRKTGYHTRVVLISTAILLVGGAILFFLTEKNASMKGMNFLERFLSSVFLSVTPRTAGFDTVGMASLSNSGKILTMFLMFIGAAPGGTGGGIKITTFVIIISTAYSSQKSKKDTVIGHHRIEDNIIKKAFCSVTSYIGMIFIGVFIICSQGVEFMNSVFECISAIGTVGLSTGVTASMTDISKVVLIMLMYIGRIGSLTVFLAMSGKEKKGGLRNPIGKLLV